MTFGKNVLNATLGFLLAAVMNPMRNGGYIDLALFVAALVVIFALQIHSLSPNAGVALTKTLGLALILVFVLFTLWQFGDLLSVQEESFAGRFELAPDNETNNVTGAVQFWAVDASVVDHILSLGIGSTGRKGYQAFVSFFVTLSATLAVAIDLFREA